MTNHHRSGRSIRPYLSAGKLRAGAALGLALALVGGCAEKPVEQAAFVRGPRPIVASPPNACAAPAELTALQARVLLSDLMVSALSCNEQGRYNAFVTKYKSDLGKQGKALQAYFQKAYGRSGRTQMNRYVTDMANNSSNYSLMHIDMFCAETGKQYEALLARPDGSLETFVSSQPHARIHGVSPCG